MNENYIKMCREAKEIQEQWKPKAGDFVTYWGERESWFFAYSYLIQNEKGEIVNEDDHPIRNCLNCIFIPRLEDLIQFIRDDFTGEDSVYAPTEIMVLKDFYKNMIPDKNDLGDKRSLNELWLCYVMGFAYGKKWDGNKWVVME